MPGSAVEAGYPVNGVPIKYNEQTIIRARTLDLGEKMFIAKVRDNTYVFNIFVNQAFQIIRAGAALAKKL
jgi:hypothetical protein